MSPLSPLCYTRIGLLFWQVKALAETIYAARGVQDALLSCKEWMALRANVNLQDWFDADGFKAIATGTADCGLNIIWMYSLFHDLSQVPLYSLLYMPAVVQGINSTVMAVSMIVHG